MKQQAYHLDAEAFSEYLGDGIEHTHRITPDDREVRRLEPVILNRVFTDAREALVFKKVVSGVLRGCPAKGYTVTWQGF